jgi:hypothetical protein
LNLFSYVKNNPTTVGDPDGHCCEFLENFISGMGNAWASDNLLGAGRVEQTTLSGKIGAEIGDTAAAFQGTDEMALGVGEALTTSPAAPSGFGAVIPLVGVGIAAHGTTVEFEAVTHLFKQGGTYTLRDDDNNVQRSGRTNDLERREGEHGRAPETKDLKFNTELKTNSKAAQRGHEQMLHDKHNPPLNKVQPISPTNPNKGAYMKAAKKALKKQH